MKVTRIKTDIGDKYIVLSASSKEDLLSIRKDIDSFSKGYNIRIDIPSSLKEVYMGLNFPEMIKCVIISTDEQVVRANIDTSNTESCITEYVNYCIDKDKSLEQYKDRLIEVGEKLL